MAGTNSSGSYREQDGFVYVRGVRSHFCRPVHYRSQDEGERIQQYAICQREGVFQVLEVNGYRVSHFVRKLSEDESRCRVWEIFQALDLHPGRLTAPLHIERDHGGLIGEFQLSSCDSRMLEWLRERNGLGSGECGRAIKRLLAANEMVDMSVDTTGTSADETGMLGRIYKWFGCGR